MLDAEALDASGLPRLAEVLAAGVDWLQLRERGLPGAALLERVDALLGVARDTARRAGRSVRVLVNRFCDVALAAGADGVHLGFDALSPEAARRLLPPPALLGVSCHAPSELAALAAADYAHLAPIFEPLSKPAQRPPLGLAALTACAGAGRPVLAQGGITPERARACVAAGARGVAVTGAVLGARDPARSAAELRAALDGASSPGGALPKRGP